MVRVPSGIPSAAQISGHPLHPMFVPFPIAYLVGASVTDLANFMTGDLFWARMSAWLILAGLVTGAIAAGLGLVEFYSRPAIRAHRIAWHHFIGNATVMILALINLLLRNEAPMTAVTPGGIGLSLITVGILGYTGWLGGELTYRHHVGSIRAFAAATTLTPGDANPASVERRRGAADRRAHPAAL